MNRIIFALSFLISIATVSAQEFEVTPPAQGGSSEIKHPEQVQAINGVISAATAQDAANAAVGQLKESTGTGVSQLEVGSGLGYLARGQGSFDAKMANPNAVRIARRNATLQAYTDAEAKLTQFLQGASVNANFLLGEANANLDTADEALLNSTSTQEEKLNVVFEGIIAGYVLYDVEYQANEVYVSIIVTPKTLRGLSAHTSNKVTLKQAKNAEAGVDFVKDDINTMLENNLIFPVGGKQIFIRPTNEFAFLGFATEPILQNEKWPALQQRKQRTLALEKATGAAQASLVGMLQGKKVGGALSNNRATDQNYNQFKQENGFLRQFEDARQEFLSLQETNKELSSAISGKLPTGVQTDSYYYDDNNDGINDWAFAIAVYIPAVSAQAGQLKKDMNKTLNPPQKKAIPKLRRESGNLPSGKPTKNSDL